MDVYDKPESPDEDVISNLGPLAPLAGVWEGDKGLDISPSRNGPAETHFRERVTFEPMGPVVNGPQLLYGLRYSTVAWPFGEDDPFHEELGYWMWDPKGRQVMRSFMVPRVVNMIAGGEADPHARSFSLAADMGSESYGILSNPFLLDAFRTTRYTLEVTIHNENNFSYSEDTELRIHGHDEIFHHTDENTLLRVS